MLQSHFPPGALAVRHSLTTKSMPSPGALKNETVHSCTIGLIEFICLNYFGLYCKILYR